MKTDTKTYTLLQTVNAACILYRCVINADFGRAAKRVFLQIARNPTYYMYMHVFRTYVVIFDLL